MFRTPVDGFVPDFLRAQNMVRVSGSSSYPGFELPSVKLQWMYDGNPGEIDFGSSYREVRVSEGSSYGESTVLELRLSQNPAKWWRIE